MKHSAGIKSKFWKNPRFIFGTLAVLLIAASGVQLLLHSYAASSVVSGETENGALNSQATIITDSNASGGKAVKFGGTAAGFTSMTVPSYAGSTWTGSNLTSDERFKNLNNWNYGIGGSQNCAAPTSCNYFPWFASGTAPYYGGALSPANVSNYDVPGNVSQTSSGLNETLLNTYTPQTFNANGWGVSFTAHHSSTALNYDVNGTNDSFNWTSGALNTFNKVYFPSGTNKQFYLQIKAQMMGNNGSDNGAWNAIWLLGQGNGARELDLQETGICGQSPDVLCSHIQDPASNVVDSNSGQDLSAGYHIYGIEYNGTTGATKFYLDNKLEGSVTQATNTGPYYLLLDGDLGNGFAGASPPTNNVDMSMNFMQVQVYQR